MTKAELSQLFYLNREIEAEKRRIAELEAKATNISANVTGMPGVSSTPAPTPQSRWNTPMEVRKSEAD